MGHVGPLDEDLDIVGRLQRGLSELLGASVVTQWPLWEYHVVRNWFEKS